MQIANRNSVPRKIVPTAPHTIPLRGRVRLFEPLFALVLVLGGEVVVLLPVQVVNGHVLLEIAWRE